MDNASDCLVNWAAPAVCGQTGKMELWSVRCYAQDNGALQRLIWVAQLILQVHDWTDNNSPLRGAPI